MYHDIDLRRKPLFLVNAWNGLAAMDGVGSVSETLPWLRQESFRVKRSGPCGLSSVELQEARQETKSALDDQCAGQETSISRLLRKLVCQHPRIRSTRFRRRTVMRFLTSIGVGLGSELGMDTLISALKTRALETTHVHGGLLPKHRRATSARFLYPSACRQTSRMKVLMRCSNASHSLNRHVATVCSPLCSTHLVGQESRHSFRHPPQQCASTQTRPIGTRKHTCR